MSLLPGDHNITIYQGDIWTEAFHLQTWTNYPDTPATYADEDLTGKTVRLQVRPNVQSSTVLLSASTTDGRITVPTPTNGWVYITVGGDITKLLDFDCAVWDIETYSNIDNPQTFLKGDFFLERQSTK